MQQRSKGTPAEIGWVDEGAPTGAEDQTVLLPLAVGSCGLATMRRMRLGSVSPKVLRAAEGPVLVYPPQEDE